MCGHRRKPVEGIAGGWLGHRLVIRSSAANPAKRDWQSRRAGESREESKANGHGEKQTPIRSRMMRSPAGS